MLIAILAVSSVSLLMSLLAYGTANDVLDRIKNTGHFPPSNDKREAKR